jgi:hypothetical protein
MHGIYNYMRETKHTSSAYNVGFVMYSQFFLHIMLFTKQNMFCILMLAHSEMCAVSNMAVFVVP